MGHNTKVLKSTPDPKKPNKPKDIVVGNSSTEDWLNEFDTDEESENRNGGTWNAEYPDGYIFMHSNKIKSV